MSEASVYSIKHKSNDGVLSEIQEDSRTTSQYQIKPGHKEGFQEHGIKEIISNVLIEVLDGECTRIATTLNGNGILCGANEDNNWFHCLR